jgi:hypothetical protein
VALGRARAGALGPSLMRPGERALVAAVLGTGAAVEQLGPALMRAHAAADHVVGLDVDRDDFDKFAYRSRIDSLLMELWNDEGARLSTPPVRPCPWPGAVPGWQHAATGAGTPIPDAQPPQRMCSENAACALNIARPGEVTYLATAEHAIHATSGAAQHARGTRYTLDHPYG